MGPLLQGIVITVGSGAILAVTGGLIRLALIVRDTSRAAVSLTRTVEELQTRQLDHEQRIARSEGAWRALADGRHRR